ncbi:hypothetical protein J2T10_003975 [Paenarthrobacter nicotinovorans]|uniref:Uncharacterized protein n=1 Tax=Paenarthrobacter nicotinovorans TaxID=29320 RepID=A0ABT9TRK3_PAENI|nr:hypothetical protein [Paenarthrobacter nicotinovorans]
MGVIVGPRVIDPGLSLVTALLAPVAVAAGYPSPAQDYFDGRIDLNGSGHREGYNSEAAWWCTRLLTTRCH